MPKKHKPFQTQSSHSLFRALHYWNQTNERMEQSGILERQQKALLSKQWTAPEALGVLNDFQSMQMRLLDWKPPGRGQGFKHLRREYAKSQEKTECCTGFIEGGEGHHRDKGGEGSKAYINFLGFI